MWKRKSQPVEIEYFNGDYDTALLARIARGDVGAYRLLLERHIDIAMKVATRMLGNRQDAEDIIQEVSLKIWKEAGRWQPKAKFSTWLYRVVLNCCIDHQRKMMPITDTEMQTIPDEARGNDELLADTQEALQVRSALQRLPPRQRAAIILSYYEEVSNQHAADTLGVPIGAFQQLLFRAKTNLKKDLSIIQMELNHD